MSRKRTRSQRRGKSRRPRTISISLDRRGQTTQDFAVGIGVFLLAIAFVFSFLPTVVTPFDSSISGAETAQADRITDRIIHNVSTGSGNEINSAAFNTTYANGHLTENLSLRSSNGHQIDRVNISIEMLNDDATIDEQANRTAGDVYDEQAAASSARIVTIKDGSGNCDPACRIVVRVW